MVNLRLLEGRAERQCPTRERFDWSGVERAFDFVVVAAIRRLLQLI